MTTHDSELFRVLIQQHRELDELLAELADADDAETRAEIYPRMKARLLSHAKAEEATLYPALAEAGEDEESEHAEREHKEIEAALQALDALDWDDDGFEDAVAELVQCVEHHVEEEESDLFDAAWEAFDEQELDDLAARFLTRYDDELATRTAGEKRVLGVQPTGGDSHARQQPKA